MSLRGNPSHTFKMILLGESGSGKSCLFHRIIYDHYKYAGTYENKTTTPTASGGLANVHYENHTKEVTLTGNLRVNVCNNYMHNELYSNNAYKKRFT